MTETSMKSQEYMTKHSYTKETKPSTSRTRTNSREKNMTTSDKGRDKRKLHFSSKNLLMQRNNQVPSNNTYGMKIKSSHSSTGFTVNPRI